tara:strand:+ start:87 stop:557 length:471 start_codon:yes stop_codon:yes gene_type:complete
MTNKILSLLALLILTGCSSLNPLSLFGGGGGPNVAANTQLGAENTQAAVAYDTTNETSTEAGRDVIQTEVLKEIEASGTVGAIKVLNTNVPFWYIVFLILGWMLPSPMEIWRGFINILSSIFSRNKNKHPMPPVYEPLDDIDYRERDRRSYNRRGW